jgi:hypothetical protein
MRRTAGSLVLAALAVTADRVAAQTYDPPGQKLVGRIHDTDRAAKQRQEELSVSDEVDRAHVRYARVKKEITNATGLNFWMETSFMSQWGTPNGGYGAVQAMFTPGANWDIFASPSVGAGSVQFQFLAAQYLSGASGTSLGSNINLISPINNQPLANQQFVQLTYTHRFPGEWLAMAIGQYAFSGFDGNAYANNQQMNFIGYSLTQNGSQSYGQAGLGAYAQLNPIKEITFAAGFQDANDFSGSYIQFPTVGQGQYAWFGYAAWSPTIKGRGQGNYALLYYNQPGVSLQPLPSSGLSFSASQKVDSRLGLFLRANTAWQSSFAIQSSIAGGVVLNDPVQHSKHDQIGLAMAWNATNMSLFAGTFVRPSETMVEAYWSWSLYHGFLITPDVQLYLQPALAPSNDLAAVFTIRVTHLF